MPENIASINATTEPSVCSTITLQQLAFHWKSVTDEEMISLNDLLQWPASAMQQLGTNHQLRIEGHPDGHCQGTNGHSEPQSYTVQTRDESLITMFRRVRTIASKTPAASIQTSSFPDSCVRVWPADVDTPNTYFQTESKSNYKQVQANSRHGCQQQTMKHTVKTHLSSTFESDH